MKMFEIISRENRHVEVNDHRLERGIKLVTYLTVARVTKSNVLSNGQLVSPYLEEKESMMRLLLVTEIDEPEENSCLRFCAYQTIDQERLDTRPSIDT